MLEVGMTESEVLELLGPPIKRVTKESVIASMGVDLSEGFVPEFLRSPDITLVFPWTYGRIKFDSPVMPGEYDFQVGFVKGKVDSIDDPFDGQLSPDGVPTTPVPIVPQDKTVFAHYPRFVDLRWTLSSGEYPMTYDVAIESAVDDIDVSHVELRPFKFDADESLHTPIPYTTINYYGASTGRWRVRAKNRLGASAWSPYRYFQFTV